MLFLKVCMPQYHDFIIPTKRSNSCTDILLSKRCDYLFAEYFEQLVIFDRAVMA